MFLVWGISLLALPACVRAQDANDAPLGDVARSFRRKTVTSDAVIDNDNLTKVVDNAESRRASGASPVFSLDTGGKSFHVSSPDVSCSLSFTAKNGSSLSEPLLDDLPRTELAKLDGPATLDGDSLQVSVHNGTSWELRELVIGLTIVQRAEAGEPSSSNGQARMIPAVADLLSQPESYPKQPDMTLLLKVKGSAVPSATALFRTALNFALFPDQDWHWAIVKAKGIPPQKPPLVAITQSGKADNSAAGASDANAQTPLLTPVLSNVAPSNPSAASR
jgi:hypothetical protein